MFYGTPQERSKYIRDHGLMPLYVVLARNAMRRLLGWTSPVDVQYCSGDDDLSTDDAMLLDQTIRMINHPYERKAA